MKKRGPSIDPCGTPVCDVVGSEVKCWNFVTWVLFSKYDFVHAKEESSRPKLLNFCRSKWWFRQSKALERSSVMRAACFLLSNAWCTSFKVSARQVMVLCWGR